MEGRMEGRMEYFGQLYAEGVWTTTAKTPETRMNTGLLKAQTGVWQRFGNI